MNKIIPFNKTITLNERFDELTKIALDDTLKLNNDNTIIGDLIIRGCYKIENREEAFSYPIPVEIAIDDKYDTSKCNINIDDFYYEIINSQNIKVKIDILLDNLFYEERHDELMDEINEEYIEPENNINTDLNINNDVVNESNNKLDDLFMENNNEKEYSIYRVYTVLEGETLEYILDKYQVSRDDLLPYNDLDNFKVGMKLIIPSIDE